MKVLHDGNAVTMGVETIELDNYPNLKVIGCNMTGTDHLPLKECKKRGIKVISLQGETEFLKDITSTAEHTIGLMIALMRNYKKAFRNPTYDRDYYKGHTLKGKTLGIIGDGRIGKQVKNIAESFGMLVRAFNGSEDEMLYPLLVSSDVVTLHIPLDKLNNGWFTKMGMFVRMKPTAYFINTSRSKIVEDGALLWALKEREIAGAAVDFTDDKKLVDYERTHDNLILTNHIGGCTYEDMEATEKFIEDKVNTYINGL